MSVKEIDPATQMLNQLHRIIFVTQVSLPKTLPRLGVNFDTVRYCACIAAAAAAGREQRPLEDAARYRKVQAGPVQQVSHPAFACHSVESSRMPHESDRMVPAISHTLSLLSVTLVAGKSAVGDLPSYDGGSTPARSSLASLAASAFVIL